MKSASLLLILILLCSSCYENKRDCLDFQEGTFIWEQESGGKLLRTEFTRTKDLQIERFENKVDTSRIEWINDCEWRVIPIDPETNAESRAYLFKILSTDKNSYSFEFTQSGRDQIYKGTATKK